jgi:hypothetical protein
MREISTIKILEPTRISIAMGALAARPLVLDLAAGSSVPISDFQNDNTETIPMETSVDSSFMRNDTELVDSDEASTLSFRPGKNVGFPLIIKPRDRLVVNVKIKAPRNAKIGETFAVTLRQSNIKNDIIAEATVNVRIVKKR